FGPLLITFHSDAADDNFPHYITFCCADWVNRRISMRTKRCYDVIIALSVPMWVHLNDGGLRWLFERVHCLVGVRT
ncbi:hypothetical protein EDB87DRAFT_1572607, partial [Lactarius vividus]